MQFEVVKTLDNSLARTGKITTPHGEIKTPAFMPVGTQGSVKTVAPWELEELGADIILGNTYHLHVRPGEDLIKKMGGLQKWTTWNKPMLTDSGGYQAYSLGESRGPKSAKTDEEGVRFYSHIDGKKLFFTPENVLDMQNKLGSDIAMVLDDCPPLTMPNEEGIEKPVTKERVAQAVERTGEWAKRAIEHWQKEKFGEAGVSSERAELRTEGARNAKIGDQRFAASSVGPGLFGIVQGGLYEDLRLKSLEDIQSLPFDGIAIGGVAIESEGKDKINQAVEFVADNLDKKRPHYLMGVGEPEDLIRMVGKGIDMFDCVIPTRYGRHGSFWTGPDFQRKSIALNEYTADPKPLDPNCQCRTCKTFSASYLRHLFMVNEFLAGRAIVYHNLYTLLHLMEEIRASINDGSFSEKYRQYLVH